MKTRIIEIEREELAPGIFRRRLWCSIPVDQLSYQDTQEFADRSDELWPGREAISPLLLRKIQKDKKKRPHHFFDSISIPPVKEKVIPTENSSKN